MADESQDPKPEPESESPNPNPKSPPPPTMAFSSLSLSIWPPSQRTRDAVTGRLVETLSSDSSVLAKRYGVLDADDAAKLATDIEKAAFAVADSTAAAAEEARSAAADGGLEILEIYSKEISKRMLASVKARNSSPDPQPSPDRDAEVAAGGEGEATAAA